MARRSAGGTGRADGPAVRWPRPGPIHVTAALARSAGSAGATLTPHDVAIERAGAAATRLDAHIEAMRWSGALYEFNRAFKRRRMKATLNSRGFMSYRTAEARLRAALIPMRLNRQTVGPVQSLFAGIFGTT